jgi:hypothetical protein
VSLRKVMAGKKHFFDFQMFKDGRGIQNLQFMEGIIDDSDVYYPQGSVTTHLMPDQESIYLGAFICGRDATCWALDCQLNK